MHFCQSCPKIRATRTLAPLSCLSSYLSQPGQKANSEQAFDHNLLGHEKRSPCGGVGSWTNTLITHSLATYPLSSSFVIFKPLYLQPSDEPLFYVAGP